MRARMWLGVALAVGLAGAMACGDSGTAPSGPTDTTSGAYALQRVNGQLLPALYSRSADTIVTVTDGVLTLRVDHSYNHTYHATVEITDQPDQTQTIAENGTYSVSGQVITFSVPAQANQPAYSYTGSIEASGIGYAYGADSYVFTKQ